MFINHMMTGGGTSPLSQVQMDSFKRSLNMTIAVAAGAVALGVILGVIPGCSSIGSNILMGLGIPALTISTLIRISLNPTTPQRKWLIASVASGALMALGIVFSSLPGRLPSLLGQAASGISVPLFGASLIAYFWARYHPTTVTTGTAMTPNTSFLGRGRRLVD